MGNYYFKILDYKKSSKIYNNVVNLLTTTGTTFQFSYIPFGNYESFIMFDYVVSDRKKKVEKLNKVFIQFLDRFSETAKTEITRIDEAERTRIEKAQKIVIENLTRKFDKIILEVIEAQQLSKPATARSISFANDISGYKYKQNVKATLKDFILSDLKKDRSSFIINLSSAEKDYKGKKAEYIDLLTANRNLLNKTGLLTLLDGGRKEARKAAIEEILLLIRNNQNKVSIEKIISTIVKDLFGYVMDDYILSSIIKEGIPAIITDYVVDSTRQINKEAFTEKELFELLKFFDRIKEKQAQTLITEDTFAQKKQVLKEGTVSKYIPIADGLIYDHNHIDWSTDQEKYIGGYGVPEDYESDNPFNVYYPWSEPFEIKDSSWKVFGTNTWNINTTEKTFVCTDSKQTLGGFILDDLNKKEYTAKVKFKVTDTNNDGVGVYINYIDELNHYRFTITGGNTKTLNMSYYMELVRVVNGSETVVSPPLQQFYWDKDKWYTIETVVLDGRIKVLVNNVLQYDIST